uniref:Chitin-binding type-1 domain-containing protein n=1 Tax=Solanum lycopersicum TaxID=4081 RepID=A0A3Q7FSI4_SOLLC
MRISILALLALFLLEAVLANEVFDVPMNETIGVESINASVGGYPRCGAQGDGGNCPSGMCCSVWGWCGKTYGYCAPQNCQKQCPAPYPEGRCGWQADGKSCPNGKCCSYGECGLQKNGERCTKPGECCSIWGLCGATYKYCDPQHCQKQCSAPFPPGRCGWQADGRPCPTGQCCSFSGWCGTTSAHCTYPQCVSQCNDPRFPSSLNNRIQSFML